MGVVRVELVVAVDPGVHACGVAVLSNNSGALRAAGYVRAKVGGPCDLATAVRAFVNSTLSIHDKLAFGSVALLVVEKPKIYPGTPHVDANDLIDLAAVVGALLVAIPADEVRTPHPQEWKGQIPKPKRSTDPYIVEERNREKLTPEEVERIEYPRAKGLRHNVTDAVGIGLWALRREALR